MKPCTSLCPTPRMLCPLLHLPKLVSPQYVVCALLVAESLGSTSNLKTARGQVLRTCFLTSCPGWFNGPDSLRTPHPGRQMSIQFPPLLPTTASPASDITIFRIAIYLILPCLLFFFFFFFFPHTHCILFLQEINRLTPSIVHG